MVTPNGSFIFQLTPMGDIVSAVVRCAKLLTRIHGSITTRAEVLRVADSLIVEVLSRDPSHRWRLVQAQCRIQEADSAVQLLVIPSREAFGVYTDLVFDLWVAFVLATALGSEWGSLIRVRGPDWPAEKKSVGIFSGETAESAFANALDPLGFSSDSQDMDFIVMFVLAIDRFMPEPSLWRPSFQRA